MLKLMMTIIFHYF